MSEKKLFIVIGIVTLIILIGGFFLSQGLNQESNSQAITGKPAPNFSLPSTAGKKITLSDFKGKKNVLLYFHEGLSCDPCMQQIPELEKSMDEFDKLNIQVLAISGVDSIGELKQSLDRFGIKKVSLLSYTDARTEKDYNLLPYSMGMGRRAGHTFVLVGADGKITWRKDYWPRLGHMVPEGTMFVEAQEIVNNVESVLNK